MTNEPDQMEPTREELLLRVRQLEGENRRLRERCQEAELESVELEKRLKNTENTLSFRLGHALIEATKSSHGMRALPAVLAELRRDSGRRKKQGEPGLLAAAGRSSLARLERLLRPGGQR
jgi:predicted nuclease with TOPRIM domain